MGIVLKHWPLRLPSQIIFYSNVMFLFQNTGNTNKCKQVLFNVIRNINYDCLDLKEKYCVNNI